MKILAIGAHPDDIEIYMFGLLMVFLNQGNDVYPLIATDGSLGTVSVKKKLKIIRKKEAKISLKKYISSISPDLIITHSPLDYHPDHRALSKYVKEATGFYCPIIYADTLMGVNFKPTIYIDISKHIEEKLSAIMCHKSQNPEKFVNATKLLNKFRSGQCNGELNGYAEAYSFDRVFPFSDIRSLLPPAPKTNKYYSNVYDSFL